MLSPQGRADGDLVGARLVRSLVGGPIEPGRSLVQFGEGSLTLRTRPELGARPTYPVGS